MKPKTMIFLLALLGACLIFIVLRGGYRRGERPTVEIAPAKSIFPSVPDSLKELVITAADGSRMAFVKDGGQWWITEPIKARAGNIILNDLAGSIADLRQAERGQKEPLDDDVTGLASPQWTIKITDVAGRMHTIQVGLPAPLSKGDRTFIRLDDGPAVVAAMDFKAALDRPVADFRDKSLWDAASFDVTRIEVMGLDKYELARRDSAWLLKAANVSSPADKDKVRLLIDKLRYLTIEEFVADKPANLKIYGLDEPRLIISFELAGPKAASLPATASAPASMPVRPAMPVRRYTLVLGNAAGDKVYAKLIDCPAVFLLEGTALNYLGPRVKDFPKK